MRDVQKIDKFEITGKLGQGSFGVVYRARDPFLKRDLAIKVCTVEDESLRKRFYREAEIAGRLQHKNIVTVFSFGVENDHPYLVQEYLAGRDLDQVIKGDRPLSAVAKVELLLQVAEGLRYAHERGVIHRDIKPGNIRLLDDGRIKIMDFGIAKLASAQTQLTQQGVTMGTASYLPPEQVRAEELDHRADLFSFGVLAYELLSHERPFRGNTLSALVYQILYKVPAPLVAAWPDCPEPLSDVVAKCLEKKPDRRYPNLDALIPELERVRDGLATGEWPALGIAEVPPQPQVPGEQGVDAEAATALRIPSDEHAATLMTGGGRPGPSPDQTQPIKVVTDDALAAASDEKGTVQLTSGPLVERAQEIGSLIAQGELESAMKELEDTYHRLRDPAEASSATAPTAPGVGVASEGATGVAPPEAQPTTEAAAPAVPSGTVPPAPVASAPVSPAVPVEAADAGSVLDGNGSADGGEPIEVTEPIAIGDPGRAAGGAGGGVRAGTGRVAALATTLRQRASVQVEALRAKGGPWPWLALAGALVAVLLLIGLLRAVTGSGGDDQPAARAADADIVQPAPPPPAVPMAPDLGALQIDALPWATVVEVTDASGRLQPLPADAVTPLRLELPPGRYLVTFATPETAEEPLTCEVEVERNVSVPCVVRVGASPDPVAYFKAIGWWR